jgi:hypothetical protein
VLATAVIIAVAGLPVMPYDVEDDGGRKMAYTNVAAFALKNARSSYVTESYTSKPVKAIPPKTGKSASRKAAASSKKK